MTLPCIGVGRRAVGVGGVAWYGVNGAWTLSTIAGRGVLMSIPIDVEVFHQKLQIVILITKGNFNLAYGEIRRVPPVIKGGNKHGHGRNKQRVRHFVQLFSLDQMHCGILYDVNKVISKTKWI